MPDQADEQNNFLSVYDGAVSLDVRNAIGENHRRGGAGLLSPNAQGSLNSLTGFQSQVFVGVLPDEPASAPPAGPNKFGGDGDEDVDDDTQDDDTKGDDDSDKIVIDEAFADAFFARWDDLTQWMTAAADDVDFTYEDSLWVDLEAWMDSERSWQGDQDDYLDDLTSDWNTDSDTPEGGAGDDPKDDGTQGDEPDDETGDAPGGDTGNGRFSGSGGGGGEDEAVPEVVLGEGYEAEIDLTEIDPRKLETLVKAGTLAQAYKVEEAFNWFWFSREETTVEKVQSSEEADVVVVGRADGPKIAIFKHIVDVVNNNTSPFAPYPNKRIVWSAWSGANADTGLKMFTYSDAFKGLNHYVEWEQWWEQWGTMGTHTNLTVRRKFGRDNWDNWCHPPTALSPEDRWCHSPSVDAHGWGTMVGGGTMGTHTNLTVRQKFVRIRQSLGLGSDLGFSQGGV